MRVKSKMKAAVRFGSIILEPMAITYVDENVVSAKKLLACYGQRIAILPDEDEQVKEALQENPEVKAFLEGETDVVPEGTAIVPEGEIAPVVSEGEANVPVEGEIPTEGEADKEGEAVVPEGEANVPTEGEADKEGEAVVPEGEANVPVEGEADKEDEKSDESKPKRGRGSKKQ